MILFLNLINLNGYGKNQLLDLLKRLLKVHKSLNYQLMRVNLRNLLKHNYKLIKLN